MELTTTVGKVIECRAAVAWAVGEPLTIETVQVAVPLTGEVRIKIVASGVCHTDLFFQRGGDGPDVFPCILGHEGAGIVESVGPNVTSVEPGDHVIPVYTAQCYNCEFCKSTETNICNINGTFQLAGLMNDGTTRFTCRGQSIKHNMGCSTFSEYTVVYETNVCKINPGAPLEKIGLIGCGIGTGYGAVVNTAKVRAGSTVGIWGLGGVGLAVVMGAKKAGAARIIGIDINPSKENIGKKFGITDFINPDDYKIPIEEVIMDMATGGLDYAFECCGISSCMKAAMNACKEGLSVLTIVGVADLTAEVSYNPIQLIYGRTIKGTYFGGWKSRDQIPKLVDAYLAKELMVDEFISHTMPIENINEAVELIEKGECLRSMVTF